MVFMFGEDLPVETNAVTLDPEVTDSDGIPAAHVNYELHENDIALAKYGIDKIFEATRAVGAVETNDTGVLYPPPAWPLYCSPASATPSGSRCPRRRWKRSRSVSRSWSR